MISLAGCGPVSQETRQDRAALAQVELPEVSLPEPPSPPSLNFVRLKVDGRDFVALPAEQAPQLRDFLVADQAFHEKCALRFQLLKEQNRLLRRFCLP